MVFLEVILVLLDSVIDIGNYAFLQNRLEKLIISNSVVDIGKGAFTNIIIPMIVLQN